MTMTKKRKPGLANATKIRRQDNNRLTGRIKRTAVTGEELEERAVELAAMDGRGPDGVRLRDHIRAKRELLNAIHPVTRQKEEPVVAGTLADPVPGATGRAVAKALPTDDQLTAELVEEGVDGAGHQSMAAAASTKTPASRPKGKA